MATEQITILGLIVGWDAITALATLATAMVAGYQISSLRKENIRARTLAACERYDLDPVLSRASSIVRKAYYSKALTKRPLKYEHEAVTVLNFFEQLAIGARKKAYDKAMLYDYMDGIMRGYKMMLINSGATARMKAPYPEYYSEFGTLCDEWEEKWEEKIIDRAKRVKATEARKAQKKK